MELQTRREPPDQFMRGPVVEFDGLSEAPRHLHHFDDCALARLEVSKYLIREKDRLWYAAVGPASRLFQSGVLRRGDPLTG